jgi:NADH dehydrogenase (ubiquinone) Fe-S protein 5
MQDAYRKAEAAHPRENAPKPGEIRSLGLIGKEEESKNVLKS